MQYVCAYFTNLWSRISASAALQINVCLQISPFFTCFVSSLIENRNDIACLKPADESGIADISLILYYCLLTIAYCKLERIK